MTVLPFVAEPPGDPGLVEEVAQAAARAWGLAAPELLRAGMNVLFSCGEEVVLRVGRTTAPPEQGVWLLGLLTGAGLRVPRAVVAEPFLHPSGLSVVALERLHPSGPIDWREVGGMIRRLHSLAPAEVEGHYPLACAVDFPHWEIERVRREVDDLLQPAAAAALDAALVRAADWRGRCAAEPQVLCHGDVHPGNVLQSADGPVLLDWDLMCTGPAAWDHAAVMTWGERWDGEPDLYAEFAAGYGGSLRSTAAGEMLAEVRLLVATLMRVRAGRHDPVAAEEADRRLRYWLGDPDAPRWRPA